MSIAQMYEYNKQRFIGCIEKDKGPIILIVGGMHGNEPAGLRAIELIMSDLARLEDKINGSIYAIKGNLKAINAEARYIDSDLNRMWSNDLREDQINNNAEYHEFTEIKNIITEIKANQGDRHFILLDLHTTSSSSLPFILCSNEVRNRKLVMPIPAPTVLGIENRIKGTLMNYFNDMGDSGIVFEAGRHDDPLAIKYHKSIIQLLLVGSGILNQCDFENFEEIVNNLYHHSIAMQYIFDIMFRYGIKEGEQFKMRPGFENFMKIEQGTVLADNQHGEIVAPLPGRIFMPLYQAQGSDGFFIIDDGKS